MLGIITYICIELLFMLELSLLAPPANNRIYCHGFNNYIIVVIYSNLLKYL